MRISPAGGQPCTLPKGKQKVGAAAACLLVDLFLGCLLAAQVDVRLYISLVHHAGQQLLLELERLCISFYFTAAEQIPK